MIEALVDLLYPLLGTNPVVWLAWVIYLAGVSSVTVCAIKSARKERSPSTGSFVILVLTWPLWCTIAYIYTWSEWARNSGV